MVATGALRALVLLGVLLVLHPLPAFSQTPPAAAPESLANWRVTGGYAWFSSRDVARTGRPLDASPVSWYGRGFRVEVERARSSISRMHRLIGSVSMTGAFEYRSPLQTSPRPSSDRHRAVEGRYEYRRYLLRDVGFAGLDVGLGGQAIGHYASSRRSVATDISASESTVSGGMTVVVAARMRRWPGVQAEVDWANGARIARLRHQHSESPTGGEPAGGGGWISDLGVTVDLRLMRTTTLAVRYSRSSIAQYSSHRTAFMSHGSLTAGVVYAR